MIGEVESGLDAISSAGDGATVRITGLDDRHDRREQASR